MSSERKFESRTISLRVPPAKLHMIDPAAYVSRQSRENFIVEAFVVRASGILADYQNLALSDDQIALANAMLETPTSDHREAAGRLMATTLVAF